MISCHYVVTFRYPLACRHLDSLTNQGVEVEETSAQAIQGRQAPDRGVVRARGLPGAPHPSRRARHLGSGLDGRGPRPPLRPVRQAPHRRPNTSEKTQILAHQKKPGDVISPRFDALPRFCIFKTRDGFSRRWPAQDSRTPTPGALDQSPLNDAPLECGGWVTGNSAAATRNATQSGAAWPMPQTTARSFDAGTTSSQGCSPHATPPPRSVFPQDRHRARLSGRTRRRHC